MVVLSERRYYKSGIPADKAASNFWIKLFTATFAIGVATGITMEFAFGTNWAELLALRRQHLRRAAGGRGPVRLLPRVDLPRRPAVRPQEGLQALLLRLRLAGVDRRAALRAVDPHRQLVDADAGRLRDRGRQGRADELLGGGAQPVHRPALLPHGRRRPAHRLLRGGRRLRLLHAQAAAPARSRARPCCWAAWPSASCSSIAMPFLGHWGALVVAEYQPVKMAAFENVGDTQTNAPLYLFGWVRQRRRRRPASASRAASASCSA